MRLCDCYRECTCKYKIDNTKLMQTYKTAGERRDMIMDGSDERFDSVGVIVLSFESKLVCDVWNAAIEAAANEADNIDGRATPEEIRKLKK